MLSMLQLKLCLKQQSARYCCPQFGAGTATATALVAAFVSDPLFALCTPRIPFVQPNKSKGKHTHTHTRSSHRFELNSRISIPVECIAFTGLKVTYGTTLIPSSLSSLTITLILTTKADLVIFIAVLCRAGERKKLFK